MLFSHDGMRDSLTHVAAPAYFYENLRREILQSSRGNTPLTLLRLTLLNNQEGQSESGYEAAIIALAESVKLSIRAEDLAGRLSQFEFTISLRATEEVAEDIKSRILQRWQTHGAGQVGSYGFAILQIENGESSLEALNRLDDCELHIASS